MKKIINIVFMFILLVSLSSVCAEETKTPPNYDVAEGEGWLICTIQGEEVTFKYDNSTRNMTDTVHNFSSDEYKLRIVFSKLEIGVKMEENAIKSIELVSSANATSGYYAIKKSRTTDVISEVLLEEPVKPEIIQGKFSAVITPADRWVGDLRPGIIAELALEDGEFCFYPMPK